MGLIEITIEKWDKFNGEETKKTPNWFKVHVGIGSSQSLFGLSYAAKWVWVLLLAEAKKNKSPSFSLNIKWAAHLWVMKEKEILEAIESLKENGLLRVNSESTRSELRADSALERERERERDNGFSEKLEAAFEKYPKRKNTKKSLGLKRLKSLLTTQNSLTRFEQALGNYARYVKENVKDPQFIKQFSTFVNEWEEWEHWESVPAREPTKFEFEFGNEAS